ncbi:MAG: ABC transporter substrate-binding protein [Eubacteriales bacterium]
MYIIDTRRIKVFFILIIAAFAFYHAAGRLGVRPASTLYGSAGGQTIVYARGHDAETLDPAFLQDEDSATITANIFEGLVRFRPGTTEVLPCLAESWRVSADGREWTFYLRKNVLFHDGAPFNADAVRFNVERQMPQQREPGMTYASFVFGMVDQVIVTDPYIVKFILKYPYAPFLRNLAMPAAAPFASPAAIQAAGPDFRRKPVGTGPFTISEWQEGKKIVLKPNQTYWGGTPPPGRLIFTVIKQNRLRSLALKLGLVDIIDGIGPDEARYLEQKGVAILRRPGIDINFMGFYTDKKPFDLPEVRRAVSMAIDRESIVNVLYKGGAWPANGPLPPCLQGYSGDIRPMPYDPQGAKELLNRSGFPDGLKVTIIAYENKRPYNPSGGEKLAVAVQKDLAKAGIEANIKIYAWKEYKEVLLNEEGDAFFYGWSGDNGDPDNFLYTLFSSDQIGGGLNAFRYSNKELDLLLVQAQQETDPKLRENLYRAAVQEILRDSPCVFFNHSLIMAAASPGLKGFVLSEMPQPLNTVYKD